MDYLRNVTWMIGSIAGGCILSQIASYGAKKNSRRQYRYL